MIVSPACEATTARKAAAKSAADAQQGVEDEEARQAQGHRRQQEQRDLDRRDQRPGPARPPKSPITAAVGQPAGERRSRHEPADGPAPEDVLGPPPDVRSREEARQRVPDRLEEVRLPLRNQANGRSGSPMNGRSTQPICEPDQAEQDDPAPEDRLDVPAEDLTLDAVEGAGGGSSGASAFASARPARSTSVAGGSGRTRLSRCKVWSRKAIPRTPETAKTATFSSTMNG